MLVRFVTDKQKHWNEFLDTCTFSTISAKHPEVFAYDCMNCTAPDHLQLAALVKTGEEAIYLKLLRDIPWKAVV